MKPLLLLGVLPVLALSCGSGFNTWLDGRCFRKGSYDPASYYEAFDECGYNGARLPTIKSKEDNDQIFSMIRNDPKNKPTSFWLGLACNGTTFVWPDGSSANYTNFASNYTCTPASSELRYYVGSDRLWYASVDGMKGGLRDTICEGIDRSNSPCDNFEHLQLVDHADACYEVKKTEQTWKKAEDFCTKENAHLPAIHDQAMNDFIRRTAVANGFVGGIHIGIMYYFDRGWAWTDGTAIDFDNFADAFPNGHVSNCIGMDTRSTGALAGKWINVDCYDIELPYICTKPEWSPPLDVQPAGCPKSHYAPGDDIYSPGFPASPGVSSCDYLLLAPPNSTTISLNIKFVEANACCDTLTIYNGMFGSDVLDTMTGYHVDGYWLSTSTTTELRLQWNATSGSNVRGFHAVFSAYP
ncbi:hypothetical protein PMAYCL1PPCAC_21635 [Pristionchus mayeri]|uniref:CUB domain-containing protein n=1 Tax=Pristionchus mayeri TaxID=1317129 RepID=A0AAN5CVV1_9BILA|nr:hypothetical protein PMAYCL1PPCAC_21635 [Pristionchus mayeri]